MTTSVGILGGGQLAMLMCEAARELELRTVVLCPDEQAPAARFCDEFLCAAYDDEAALNRFCDACSLVTLDNEHLPDATLLHVGGRVDLHPSAALMGRLNDRLAQRSFLAELAVPQPRFRSIDDPAAVEAAQRTAAFPAFLKCRRGGYDGRGQIRVATADALAAAWDGLRREACVLEAAVDFVFEFSMIGARGVDDRMRLYPPILNHHEGGQLVRSSWPAPLPEAAAEQARKIWSSIAQNWPSRGVIAVEFFLDREGQVLVNEIAPRVHNSGHLTQSGANCSQFSLHLRALAGMPLPELETRDAAMLNLYPHHAVGDAEQRRQLERAAGGRIIDYGKTPRPRRKMGHWLLDPEALDHAQSLLSPASENRKAESSTPS